MDRPLLPPALRSDVAGTGLFCSAVLTWGATEHRAVEAGHPEGTAEAVRAQRRRDAEAVRRR